MTNACMAMSRRRELRIRNRSRWLPAGTLPCMHDVFSATAAEVRARGAQQCLAPVVDLARDPRWGRTEETYGEDPYLVSTNWRGRSGRLSRQWTVHRQVSRAGNAQTLRGSRPAGRWNQRWPRQLSERVIREYFLKPFEAGVKEAHARTVWRPTTRSTAFLRTATAFLTEILRHEWGFDGLLVSDYFAISDLRTLHHVAATDDEAAENGARCRSGRRTSGRRHFPRPGRTSETGRIAASTVDQAAAHMLREKFLTGLFDDPYVDPLTRRKSQTARSISNSRSRRRMKRSFLLKNK